MAEADLSTGAAYLTIHNDGDEADRLTGATTPMAQAVEIHETRDENGVGTMRMQEDGVEIPAGATVAFAPVGLHLMLVGLTASLLSDTTYELTLTFARAGKVTVTVPVRRDAPEGDEAGASVTVGDLTIEGAWSRPAPKLDVDAVASPEASPEHHHGD
jgi:copper(I)-binding protein